MSIDLPTLIDPGHTALLTVEVQRNIVGADSTVTPLAQAVADGDVLVKIAALCRGARAAGIPVLHCTADSRPDGRGGNRNARLFALARRSGRADLPGRETSEQESATVHDDVGVQPEDFVLPRLHGVSPMTGTSVDPLLRNLGVSTIVATGVSVNVALMGLVFEAVNNGYQLVLVRDATAGVNASYVDAVYENTFALLATITTTAAVIAAWSEHGSRDGAGDA